MGYKLRRLATMRSSHLYGQDLPDLASLPAGCMAAVWVVHLLQEFSHSRAAQRMAITSVLYEIVSVSAQSLIESLTSQLGLFGMLDLACREVGLFWPTVAQQPHWSEYQAELWLAVRTRQPPPLPKSIITLATSEYKDRSHSLQRAACLLAIALALRLTSLEWVATSYNAEGLGELVHRAAVEITAWSAGRTLEQVAEGVREWPLVQLLADLEVPDTAEVHAISQLAPEFPITRFLTSPNSHGATRIAVIPFRDTISDHDRTSRKFHCTSTFYSTVEVWIAIHFRSPRQRMPRLVVVEAGCALADCLIWAALRIRGFGGLIRAVCLEADELAVAAARRSISLHGLEGQVDVLHRRVTSQAEGLEWACDYPPEAVKYPRPPSWVLCRFVAEKPGNKSGHMSHTTARSVSIDAEVARLGLGPVDILKIAPSVDSVDALKSAKTTLAGCEVAIVATDYEQDTLDHQASILNSSQFDLITVSERTATYSSTILARRKSPEMTVEQVWDELEYLTVGEAGVVWHLT